MTPSIFGTPPLPKKMTAPLVFIHEICKKCSFKSRFWYTSIGQYLTILHQEYIVLLGKGDGIFFRRWWVPNLQNTWRQQNCAPPPQFWRQNKLQPLITDTPYPLNKLKLCLPSIQCVGLVPATAYFIRVREVNKKNLLGGQFLIFLPKNPEQ